MEDHEIDNERIDEAMLGLMFLTLHGDRGPFPVWRAWKSFDWTAMGRLHAKGLILDPIGKAKSVVLTEEGLKRSKEAFYRLFARRKDPPADSGN